MPKTITLSREYSSETLAKLTFESFKFHNVYRRAWLVGLQATARDIAGSNSGHSTLTADKFLPIKLPAILLESFRLGTINSWHRITITAHKIMWHVEERTRRWQKQPQMTRRFRPVVVPTWNSCDRRSAFCSLTWRSESFREMISMGATILFSSPRTSLTTCGSSLLSSIISRLVSSSVSTRNLCFAISSLKP